MILSRRILLLGLLLLAGGALRWRVAGEFHAPAGDGLEYHKLAHELRRAGRFAYQPEPAHLSFGRMPGYPVLLAATVEAGQPDDIERTLLWGTRLNVLFDVITALLVFLLVREAGLSEALAWMACAATVLCPLLILNCCYLLRESFTTVLTTATLYLIVRSMRRRTAAPLLVAAAITGVTMLVRLDAFVVGVAFLIPLAAIAGWRRRIATALASAILCIAVFSPWPIRNEIRFHDPHLWGAAWPDPNGDPYPTGGVFWMRAWMDDLHQCWITLLLTNKRPVTPRDLDPAMWRSAAEKQELLDLFARYNREGMSQTVSDGFLHLANERLHADPFRVLVWLPIRRAFLWWYYAIPYEEQPLRSATLGQPRFRWVFDAYSHAAMVIGTLGWLLLISDRRTRRFAWLAVLVLVSRSLFMSLASPNGCQRYLAPVYPLFLIGVVSVPVVLWRRLRRSEEVQGHDSPRGSVA